jgi:hypothetical protein
VNRPRVGFQLPPGQPPGTRSHHETSRCGICRWNDSQSCGKILWAVNAPNTSGGLGSVPSVFPTAAAGCQRSRKSGKRYTPRTGGQSADILRLSPELESGDMRDYASFALVDDGAPDEDWRDPARSRRGRRAPIPHACTRRSTSQSRACTASACSTCLGGLRKAPQPSPLTGPPSSLRWWSLQSTACKTKAGQYGWGFYLGLFNFVAQEG